MDLRAGTPAHRIVEAHGSMSKCSCIDCGRSMSFSEFHARNRAEDVVACTECGGLVKPDVVFYGEDLPERFYRLARTDFEQCDLLIVIGTSLRVLPFARLIDRVGASVPRLLINAEVVGEATSDSEGFEFDGTDQRDDRFIGDCQSACRYLMSRLEGLGVE